jgi:hypothetical protein
VPQLKRLDAGFPPRRTGFASGLHVGFVMDKAALGRFSPSTSVSLANHHSTNFSIIIITRGWHNRPIGGRSVKWTQLDSTPHYTNTGLDLTAERTPCPAVKSRRSPAFWTILPADLPYAVTRMWRRYSEWVFYLHFPYMPARLGAQTRIYIYFLTSCKQSIYCQITPWTEVLELPRLSRSTLEPL